jgi:hypothetical protein
VHEIAPEGEPSSAYSTVVLIAGIWAGLFPDLSPCVIKNVRGKQGHRSIYPAHSETQTLSHEQKVGLHDARLMSVSVACAHNNVDIRCAGARSIRRAMGTYGMMMAFEVVGR